jgi:hypothetical protein
MGATGALVERFLARLATLKLADYGDAVHTWRLELRRTDAWYAAEDAVGDAIARTGRHDECWHLQGRLYRLFRESAWHTQPRTPADAEGTEAAAHYLASTAAFALLLADAITPAELRTLYAPFARAIPLPELVAPAARRPPGGEGSRHAS